MGSLREFATRLIAQVREDDVPGLGAELAFRFLFAVFPFAIFLTALGGLVATAVGIQNPAQQLVSALGDNLPPALVGPLKSEIEAVVSQSSVAILSFGGLLALYAATGGTNALIKAMNRAMEVTETRGLVGRLAVAVGLTILLAGGIIAAFVTIVGSALLTQQLADQLGVGSQARQAIDLLRWPIVFGLLVVAISVLFRFAPNTAAPWRWIVAGAVTFAVAWLVVTVGFAIYVANFAHYSRTYGALGSVIVLLLWFYLTAIVLVCAAEVVAVGSKLRQPVRPDRAVAGEADDATHPGPVARPSIDQPGRS